MRLLGEPFSAQARPVSEEVYRRLRDMIFNGELKCDEHLVERRIAEKLMVSRTPVREALRKLEAEGLAKREPYRGLVVARFTSEDLIEIMEIRETLEGLASQLAAINRTPEELARLKVLLDELDDSLGSEDHSRFLELHSEFHDAIYRAAHRPRLYNLLASVVERTEGFPRIGYKAAGRSRQAQEEHREIFARLRDKDAVAAGEIARLHIRHAKDALLLVLKPPAE